MWSFRGIVLLVVFHCCLAACWAQGGVRVLLYDFESFYKAKQREWQHFGIGFDHDLSDELSIGLDFRMGIGSVRTWAVQYRSAYHFADNEYASFYMGPTIGLRDMGDEGGTKVVPVGLRMGVRGGLERFYADLYAGVFTNFGGGVIEYEEQGYQAQVNRMGFVAGLSLGFGWEGRRGR